MLLVLLVLCCCIWLLCTFARRRSAWRRGGKQLREPKHRKLSVRAAKAHHRVLDDEPESEVKSEVLDGAEPRPGHGPGLVERNHIYM